MCLRKLSILLYYKVCIELQLHFFLFFFFFEFFTLKMCAFSKREVNEWRTWRFSWISILTRVVAALLSGKMSHAIEKMLSLKASDISQLRLKNCTRVQLARAEHLYARFIKREIQLYWRCLNRYIRSRGEAKLIDETRVKSWIKIPISPNIRSWVLRVNCIWFCVSFHDWIWHEYPISKSQARSSVMTAQQKSDFLPT